MLYLYTIRHYDIKFLIKELSTNTRILILDETNVHFTLSVIKHPSKVK